MSEPSTWIFGYLVSIVGLLGVMLAFHAVDDVMYAVGWAFFAFAVLFDIWLIKRSGSLKGILHMPNISAWIFAMLATLAGLLGLTLASHAVDSVMYFAGLVIFAFAVFFDFWLIKRGFDVPG